MKKEAEQIIINLLQEKLDPFIIYLFGSTVKGRARQDSDIDIAFVKNEDPPIEKYDLFLIAQELASRLNQDVDLIDLYQSSTVFQAQVVHTGEIIYCSDEQQKAQFEMKAFKMYTQLNEERAPILKEVSERGTIYEK